MVLDTRWKAELVESGVCYAGEKWGGGAAFVVG